MWPKDSEEFKSLRESLRSDGQLYEVLIDSGRRVVDGRNRRNALAALAQSVRCREVADEEVSTIVFRTLMQRRHLCKGARAFLAVPLVKPLIDGAIARKLACLKRGDSPVTASGGDGPTLERIARDVGVSKDTLDRAREAHIALAKAPEEIRLAITARVLSGDLDVEQVGKSVANYREQPTKTARLGLRQEHDRLFRLAVPKLVLHWTEANEAQRAKIHEDLDSGLATAPAELLEELHRASAKALKNLREGTQ